MKNPRFPLPYIIWIALSGLVFTVAMGAQLFFSRTAYGFIYNGALLLLCLGSFVVLVSGVCLWLYRHVCKKYFAKMWVVIAGLSLCAMAFFVHFFIILLLSTMGGKTITGAGSISGNRHYFHDSPRGTNRFVIMFTGMDEESIYAYPMLNRWIYREIDNGFVWESHLHEDEYTVEWPTERQAIVTILREDTETFEGENPDSRIIVNFE